MIGEAQEWYHEIDGGQEKLQVLRTQMEMTVGREASRLDGRSVGIGR